LLIANCSTTLGTCCNDPGLMTLLDVLRKLLDIIQIVVPIILILSLVIKLSQMVINPEEKKEMKKVYNMATAAIVIFFIPMLVDLTLGMMPSSFKLSSCWKSSKNIISTSSHTYINPNQTKTKNILINPTAFEKGEEKKEDPTSSSSFRGSVTGQEIVNYAMQFKGQAYKRGGSWNGELPYRPTDCFGFVTAIYKHFGYKLNWHDINRGQGNYEVVSPNDIRAGDIAYYDGHGAMFTGNGIQIIHAMSPKLGIGLSKDYRRCGRNLIHIVRVKGVN